MEDLISKGRVPQFLQKQSLEGTFLQIPHCGIWDICLLTKSRKIRVVIDHRLSDFRVMYYSVDTQYQVFEIILVNAITVDTDLLRRLEKESLVYEGR